MKIAWMSQISLGEREGCSGLASILRVVNNPSDQPIGATDESGQGFRARVGEFVQSWSTDSKESQQHPSMHTACTFMSLDAPSTLVDRVVDDNPLHTPG